MITFNDVLDYYKTHEQIIYHSIKTLMKMKKDNLQPFKQDILSFVNFKHPNNPLELYRKRVQKLSEQQKNFNLVHQYPAKKTSDVQSINREVYNLSLLLSIITTLHRFEIFEQFILYLSKQNQTSNHILSVGVGTGYELKLLYDHINHPKIQAFDSSEDTILYAKDLLTFFKYPTNCLHFDTFPLESENGIDQYRNTFDMVLAVEILEHLENPNMAITNLIKTLHGSGTFFLTMAINIAQEDHIYMCDSINHARSLVTNNNLRIIHEHIAPQTIVPFIEADRENMFKSGNYICYAQKQSLH